MQPETDRGPEIYISKLVEGGQGFGELPDGKKVFVWNALPGETVRVRLIKQKHSYAEAIAEEIIKASPERVEPLEENYLATSPWQMMAFAAENTYKKQIVADIFAQVKVSLPPFDIVAAPGKAVPIPSQVEVEHQSAGAIAASPSTGDSRMGSDNSPGVFHYRNKMEYSFWGDDNGLHLALHMRGSHGKQIVTGSSLAMPVIDDVANNILAQLQRMNVRAGDLKTIIVRCSQDHEAVAALFVKPQVFPELQATNNIKGLRVYHSNPKSPAAVRTKLLQEVGDCQLQDTLLGKTFTYDVDSFFQVNVPVFEQALQRIKERCSEPEIVDMYAGVGSIGLSVASRAVNLVELDPATTAMARVNASVSHLKAQVIEASTEKVLEYIVSDKPVIFDPPRAGLHDKVVDRVLDVKPPKIVYLSCNPSTQARDLAKLVDEYEIVHFEVFNFFPRTPHIESLAILERR